jgi:8-oxo-dGTP pyrophosphatase MutT (NUDIX family)
MEKEFRISAGAIIIREDKILLVRYRDNHGKTFLVGPGGGVLINESTDRALIREVREETGLEIEPGKILFVEDLLSGRYRMTKIWFLCKIAGGKLAKTKGAVEEEIIEVGWYRRDRLNDEVVYPDPLKKYDWNDFGKDNWKTLYLELKAADF